MKTSFITTCLNEEKYINSFLLSLDNQTKKPDEVIIVDAGSTDKTVELIRNHSKKIKVIVKKGVNRSIGRNIAIKQAKHSIIAVSDVGNDLDKDWLSQITKPFKKSDVESVGGFYYAKGDSWFQKSASCFLVVMPDKLDTNTFLPSSRSLAFKKSIFKQVGRYPEKLNTCEDLVFARLLKLGTNLVINPKALVYWHQPKNLKEFFETISGYAKGDVEARYVPHLRKILTVYFRYLIFFLLPPLFLAYLAWPIFKFSRYLKSPLAWLYLPLLQIVTDLGIILGSIKGMSRYGLSKTSI